MTITEFFSPPNRMKPDAEDSNGRLALRAVAEPDGIVVLPWDDGRRGTRWYVLIRQEQIEQAREEIVAHAGITYTDYRGQPTPPEPGDPGDEAAAQVQGPRAMIRLDLIETGARQKVGRSLGRFLDLWGVRPPPSAPPVRAAAEILRDYRLALAAGRRHDAEAALTELRASGGLEIIILRSQHSCRSEDQVESPISSLRPLTKRACGPMTPRHPSCSVSASTGSICRCRISSQPRANAAQRQARCFSRFGSQWQAEMSALWSNKSP